MGRQNQMGLAAAVLSLKMGCDYLRTEHLGITSGLWLARAQLRWVTCSCFIRKELRVSEKQQQLCHPVSVLDGSRPVTCSILGTSGRAVSEELHGSDHVHRVGGVEKELVLCKNMFDCRHVNLVVFLPAWKIDFSSVFRVLSERKDQQNLGENQSLD